MNIAKHTLACMFFAFAVMANGQNKSAAYVKYIEQYKQIAIEQMNKHGIPASITLAQALLESGAGQGELAKRSNNHFGIKCGSSWSGASVRHDDDKKGECFRKYDYVSQSYEDHSIFLKRDRYARLFKLAPDDYRGWAKGLKACGYATLPTYAERLIKIIDDYDLHQYDYAGKDEMKEEEVAVDEGNFEYVEAEKEQTKVVSRRKYKQAKTTRYTRNRSLHTVYSVNHLKCVVVRKGDTWYSISKEKGIEFDKLLKYNEANRNTILSTGMNVFLQKKRLKADKNYRGYWHKVQFGETMYTISQKYGVKSKTLYKINYKKKGFVPQRGDIILIRK
ncbi:MAG: glucosaminidase domain-containing protein [Bacteroidaceae bacterium]|nr:glucosaminidase domain-containing protein [Bacteroidaceae bacterium]